MDLLESSRTKPLKGDWLGIYVPAKGGRAIPVTIHLTDVDEDGTLQGNFALDPNWARGQGIQIPAFRSGTYSPFGSLHIVQDVIEKGYRDEVEFTGQFLVPAGRTGAIHGSVIVRRIQPDAAPKIVQMGTLSATYGAEMLLTIAEGMWTDGG
jgi:hypothetical protein